MVTFRERKVTERQLGNTVEEAAKNAETILRSIVSDGHCDAQEFDNRIDCFVVHNGRVIGEMITLPEITEQRIRETADRLRRRVAGESVALVNELWEPILISRSPSRSDQTE